jgi:hypothetical protein
MCLAGIGDSQPRRMQGRLLFLVGTDSKREGLFRHEGRAKVRLMPIILLTQEAEIRGIEVRSQPGQMVCETLSRKKPLPKKGLMEWLKV